MTNKSNNTNQIRNFGTVREEQLLFARFDGIISSYVRISRNTTAGITFSNNRDYTRSI